jgi:RNA polymerase sigma-70 factor (ECF subfamily)
MVGGGQSAAERLALGVSRREASALRQLYESHVDGLFAFVMVRARGDRSLAEDVVQDTFLAALSRVEQYDPGRGSLRSWLWTLSRNVLRRHLRHHPRQQDLRRAERRLDACWAELGSAFDGTLPGDEHLEREETRAMVTTALANLKPQHRRVLERVYVDELRLAEVARELALSGEAVKSLLARARRAFRRTFLELADEANTVTAAVKPPIDDSRRTP